MAFVQNIGRENWAKRYNDHYFHICYSFHCSYSEIRETVLYLQPERAFANVEQKNEKVSRIEGETQAQVVMYYIKSSWLWKC